MVSDTTWRIAHVPQLAWRLAHADLHAFSHRDVTSDARLLALWSHVRNLSQAWVKRLASQAPDRRLHGVPFSLADFERLSAEVLTADMLVRVWGTATGCAAAADAQATVRPVLDHVVFHVHHARCRVLEEVLARGEECAGIDRIRRRCERWTDHLIGGWLVQFGFSAYAYEPRRAWDFGEDGTATNIDGLPQRLLQHSFLEAFSEAAFDQPLIGDDWQGLLNEACYAAACEPDLLTSAWMPAEAAAPRPRSRGDSHRRRSPRFTDADATALERSLRELYRRDTPADGQDPSREHN